MIAAWMVYATALGALLAAAAVALDRLAAAGRWATRWLWIGAIAGTLVAPALLALRPRPAPPVPSATGAVGGAAAATPALGASGARRERAAQRMNLARLDRPLAVAWAAASAAFALGLLGASLAQRRVGDSWPAQVVDGARVLVAPDAGPLVLGLWRLEIVLPRWALLRTEAERRMMVAHEEEHRRARDPNLLLLGALGLAVMPLNPALWWQLRRLRLAIETDCDRRVLGAGVDVRGYGSLLLDVGSRFTTASLLTATAFSETPSLLERRIDAMTASAPRHPVARAIALGTLAAAVLALACAAPRPAPIRPASAPEPVFPSLASMRPATPNAPATPYTREQMAAAIGRYFPDVARVGAANMPIRFVLGADGRVVSASRGSVRDVLVPFGRMEYAQIENVPAGYYGPAPVQVEVLWLKADSVADSVPGRGFVVSTISNPSDTAPRGATLEDDARTWLSARPDLLRGLGARDTAYVWFVLDSARQVSRSGRASSVAAMPQAAGVLGNLDLMGHREAFGPGILAVGTVVVVAWSPIASLRAPAIR